MHRSTSRGRPKMPDGLLLPDDVVPHVTRITEVEWRSLVTGRRRVDAHSRRSFVSSDGRFKLFLGQLIVIDVAHCTPRSARAVTIASSISPMVPCPSMVIQRSGSSPAMVLNPLMTRW